ncbi:unnamed protein product [Brassica napus]|uniref:(rape) hypothetical protein n=1 Tax=Brassica napus TaxID=3708 RepID=A0A816ZQB0_BRANA|nr:unnamed protein product [Brassica napus]
MPKLFVDEVELEMIQLNKKKSWMAKLRENRRPEVERYQDCDLTNETRPIWLLNSKEVTKEEDNEFYIKAFNEWVGHQCISLLSWNMLLEVNYLSIYEAMEDSGRVSLNSNSNRDETRDGSLETRRKEAWLS